MSFVEWIFLLGGLAVVGPVVAHLLAKPRFRRVPFTMLRFLRSGQIESQSRRKLRDLLILLLRCAIIVLIAMLFAQPILHIRPKPQRTSNVYCLGLDNSMSMAYSDGRDSYLDRMIESAVDYIQAARSESVFNIYPLASADWLQGLSKDQALAAVKNLKVSPANANMGGLLSALGNTSRDAFSGNLTGVLLVSDFTPNTLKQILNVQEPAGAHNVDYRPIVSPGPINNAAIIEAHPGEIVDGRLTLNVTVANYGQTEQKRLLTAKVKTSATPALAGVTSFLRKQEAVDPASESILAEVNLSPNQRRAYQVQIDLGSNEQGQPSLPIELSLSSGDGLREDDTFYLAISIPQRKSLTVLLAGSTTNQMFLVGTALDALSRMTPACAGASLPPSTSSGQALQKQEYGTSGIRQVLLSELASTDLDSADILICSAITEPLGRIAAALRSFVWAGGRVIFFLTPEPALGAMQQLWQQDVLPALPLKPILERLYVEPEPCDERASAVDTIGAKALANYRIDSMAFKGCWQCEQHPQARCLWKFKNGLAFVYIKSLGDGISILANTSADDSLGPLAKSSASVAFCQYLLGAKDQVSENCFAYGEPVALFIPTARVPFAQQQLWIETCDARRRRVSLSESFLSVPDPGGIGWVKTSGKPAIYAGVNLPQGETDMTKPVSKEVAEIMGRVFSRNTERNAASAEALTEKKRTPLWKAFAYTLILLLLLEPAIANRLKR